MIMVMIMIIMIMIAAMIMTIVLDHDQKGDEKLPSKKKEDLQKRWNEIKDRESPRSGDELDADDQRKREREWTMPWTRWTAIKVMLCNCNCCLFYHSIFLMCLLFGSPPTARVYNETGRGHCHHRPACQHAWLTLGAVAVRPVKAPPAGTRCHFGN